MAWSKYDVQISADHVSVGIRTYELKELSEPEIAKKSKRNHLPGLASLIGTALAVWAYSLITDAAHSGDLKTGFFIAIAAAGCWLYASQTVGRPAEVTYELTAKKGIERVPIYSHSDEKIVTEIASALKQALKKRKGK